MTTDEYRAALERLGLRQFEAAKVLGVTVRTAHGYANGAHIPLIVERYLALLETHKIPLGQYL